jgi:hypothetical protein
MKTAPNQTAFETAPDKAHLTTSIFLGTDNPRHIRAIAALLAGPKSREELDAKVGCSNGPQVVAGLRSLGLDVPCRLVAGVDRDGRHIKWGEYRLSETDQQNLKAWRKTQAAELTGECS